MLKGEVKACSISAAISCVQYPDRLRIEPAWRGLRLNVNVATKLNRSHLVHGEISYILPCLSRIEIDRQASGEQAVSMEDSTACMHGSRGVAEPASENIRSEPYIVAGIAKATLATRFNVDWDAWRDDYSVVRDEIAKTYPEIFHDFNQRMWTPGGFHKPLAGKPAAMENKERQGGVPRAQGARRRSRHARARTGRAAAHDPALRQPVQYDDLRSRRSLSRRQGSRMVVLMNPDDIAASGLSEGDKIGLQTIADDGFDRRVSGFAVKAYDIPRGCIAGYYPECNPLLPLWHYAEESKVPGRSRFR